jgi:hypothetical protein
MVSFFSKTVSEPSPRGSTKWTHEGYRCRGSFGFRENRSVITIFFLDHRVPPPRPPRSPTSTTTVPCLAGQRLRLDHHDPPPRPPRSPASTTWLPHLDHYGPPPRRALLAARPPRSSTSNRALPRGGLCSQPDERSRRSRDRRAESSGPAHREPRALPSAPQEPKRAAPPKLTERGANKALLREEAGEPPGEGDGRGPRATAAARRASRCERNGHGPPSRAARGESSEPLDDPWRAVAEALAAERLRAAARGPPLAAVDAFEEHCRLEITDTGPSGRPPPSNRRQHGARRRQILSLYAEDVVFIGVERGWERWVSLSPLITLYFSASTRARFVAVPRRPRRCPSTTATMRRGTTNAPAHELEIQQCYR